MLRFFRKIRQNLLENGNIRKYLWYAVGEVFLVVIGILIALQINNWNEERKQYQLEIEVLQDLHSTLISDYWIVQAAVYWNEKSIKSGEIILDHLRNNLPYNDSLTYHFENVHVWWKGQLNLSAYERATIMGIDFIRMDSLRNSLKDLYVMNHEFAEVLNRREEMHYYNTVSTELIKWFQSVELPLEIVDSRGRHIPLDYDSLKNNELYKSIIQTAVGNRTKFKQWMEFRFREMQRIERQLVEYMEIH